jgi:hypothetical protein
VTNGWLQRSGQAWKLRTAVFGAVAGMTLLLVAVSLGRMVDRRFSDWLAVSAVIALPLLLMNLVLPMLVRCRVCGLQMETSSTARMLSRDRRVAWLESLQACPVCGDDGQASAESRERWLTSGMRVEVPYWSLARILLATVAAVVLAGGGMWIGARYRVR